MCQSCHSGWRPLKRFSGNETRADYLTRDHDQLKIIFAALWSGLCNPPKMVRNRSETAGLGPTLSFLPTEHEQNKQRLLEKIICPILIGAVQNPGHATSTSLDQDRSHGFGLVHLAPSSTGHHPGGDPRRLTRLHERPPGHPGRPTRRGRRFHPPIQGW